MGYTKVEQKGWREFDRKQRKMKQNKKRLFESVAAVQDTRQEEGKHTMLFFTPVELRGGCKKLTYISKGMMIR